MFAPRQTLHSTPHYVVEKLLDLAPIADRETIFYDIGSGDGRVLKHVAKSIGCRCEGWEINNDRAADAKNNIGDLASLVTIHPHNFLDDLERILKQRKDQLASGKAPKILVFCYLTRRGLTRLQPAFEQLGAHVITFLYQFPSCKPSQKLAASDPETPNRIFMLYYYNFEEQLELLFRQRLRITVSILTLTAATAMSVCGKLNQ